MLCKRAPPTFTTSLTLAAACPFAAPLAFLSAQLTVQAAPCAFAAHGGTWEQSRRPVLAEEHTYVVCVEGHLRLLRSHACENDSSRLYVQ